MPTKSETDTPDTVDEEQALSEEKLTLRRKFRGVEYVFQEPELGEYQEIVKAATKTEELPDGSTIERLDGDLQMQLLRKKTIVAPKITPAQIDKLGVRVGFAINQTINQLLFDREEDELVKKDAKNGSGETKGNG